MYLYTNLKAERCLDSILPGYYTEYIGVGFKILNIYLQYTTIIHFNSYILEHYIQKFFILFQTISKILFIKYTMLENYTDKQDTIWIRSRHKLYTSLINNRITAHHATGSTSIL